MWLYLRYHEDKETYYAGRTHHANYHERNSGSHGRFAVGMDSKELAVQVPTEEAHYQETEAIQFVRAFVGADYCSNKQQIHQPVTGWQWDK